MNGAGDGILSATDGYHLQWAPPGQSSGAAVAIANGETKVLSGSDVNQYVRVRRISASPLSGSRVVNLHEVFNNALGGEDVENPSVQVTEYRGLALKNVSGGTVTNLRVWIDPFLTENLAVGLVAVTSGTGMQDLVVGGDHGSAPSGVTFSSGYTSGTGVALASVSADAYAGLWLRRIVAANALPSPSRRCMIHWQWTQGDVTYFGQAIGKFRVARDSYSEVRLFHAVGAAPDLNGSYTVVSSSPAQVTGLTTAGRHYFALRRRNRYGLVSQNVETWSVELNSSGNVVADAPSSPSEVSLVGGASGSVVVSALYAYAADGLKQGNEWRIWVTTNGSDPNLLSAPTAIVTMGKSDGLAKLSYAVTGLSGSWEVRAVVRVGRTSDSKVSINTDVHALTAAGAALGSAAAACHFALATKPETVLTVWGSGNNRIDVVKETGAFRFILGGVVVAGVTNGRFFASKVTPVVVNPWGSVRVLSAMIEIDSGTGALEIGCWVNSRWERQWEIDTAGNVRVASQFTSSSYPDNTHVSSQYIEWDAAGTRVRFNDVYHGGKTVLSYGYYNGGLTAKGWRGL
jgi:hypothetical protein